jgi:hypothetical protein
MLLLIGRGPVNPVRVGECSMAGVRPVEAGAVVLLLQEEGVGPGPQEGSRHIEGQLGAHRRPGEGAAGGQPTSSGQG